MLSIVVCSPLISKRNSIIADSEFDESFLQPVLLTLNDVDSSEPLSSVVQENTSVQPDSELLIADNSNIENCMKKPQKLKCLPVVAPRVNCMYT